MGQSVAASACGARAAELASAAISVPQARQLVRVDLSRREMPAQVIDDALVVVSELIANAIRHARPVRSRGRRDVVQLRWKVIGRRVHIHVTDGGSLDRPHLKSPTPVQTGGRGLAIVNAVAAKWDVRIHDDGEVTVFAVVGP